LINETFVSHNPLRRVDALYLDANGILHNATHGPDVQLHEPDKIVIRVFTYIEKLVRLIKPKDTLFIALDGVAPRAKMNQQRQRRFRTAKEARESKDANPEDSFDSNAITPGTEFMEWITPHLKFFIQKKMSEDELWKGLKVIYSGHEVPGEGEHKIMNYIRYMKSKDDYNAEYSHCVYGLDADLIFLCLAMHDPFMYLLREEVTFEKLKKKMSRKSIFESQNFQLLHISILREYLGFEFIDSRERGQHWNE
jgi:5'-3' exoribonuclease 1